MKVLRTLFQVVVGVCSVLDGVLLVVGGVLAVAGVTVSGGYVGCCLCQWCVCGVSVVCMVHSLT